MPNRIEFIQGTLDLLVLQVLRWGPLDGHGIGQAILTRSQEALQVDHGSLYPALHRLERQGWLASEWKRSEANRRARYFLPPPKGPRRHLQKQSRWQRPVRP